MSKKKSYCCTEPWTKFTTQRMERKKIPCTIPIFGFGFSFFNRDNLVLPWNILIKQQERPLKCCCYFFIFFDPKRPKITLLNLAGVRSWTRSDVHTRLVCHMLYLMTGSWRQQPQHTPPSTSNTLKVDTQDQHIRQFWGGEINIFSKTDTTTSLPHTRSMSPFTTKKCTPDYLDIRSRKLNVLGNDSTHNFRSH